MTEIKHFYQISNFITNTDISRENERLYSRLPLFAGVRRQAATVAIGDVINVTRRTGQNRGAAILPAFINGCFSVGTLFGRGDDQGSVTDFHFRLF